MTRHPDDWEQWQEKWRQTATSQPTAAATSRQASGARRVLLYTRLGERVVAAAALSLTAVALKHAANPFEAVLGLIVGVAIAGVWIQRILIRRQEHDAGLASTVEHLALVRNVRVHQVRLARFIWLVLALDLVFLIPWWVVGSRVHPRNITHLQQWPFFWLPIAGIAFLCVWSIRFHRRARADALAIDRVRAMYDDEVQ